MDREAASRIKSIALVEATEPEVSVAYPPPYRGAILTGAMHGEFVRKSELFKAALRSQGIDVRKRLLDKVATRLQTLGFRVERVPEVRDAKTTRIQLERIKATTDALLLIDPLWLGYSATAETAPYRPRVIIISELVDRKERDRLYRDGFFYGPEPLGDYIYFASSPELAFDSFDDLMARAKLAGEGLNRGADQIADAVAKPFIELRR
jgi:hypothetical protein